MFITDVKIEELVNSVITERVKVSDRDYSYFHSSEWNRCHRKIAYEYYRARGYIQVDTSQVSVQPGLQKIFDNGHYLHDRCRSYLEATGALKGWWSCYNLEHHNGQPHVLGRKEKLGILRPAQCDCGSTKLRYHEVKFFCDETNWGGSVDGILDCSNITEDNNQDNKNTHLIIDFKSINHFQYNKLIGPKSEHYSQMQIYLYLSGLQYGKFVYENKNTQEWTEYLVVRDDAWIERESIKAKELNYIIRTPNSKGQRVVPPRPYPSIADECVECIYSNLCWKS